MAARSLGTRLFLLTAVLVTLAVGSAVVVTLAIGRQIAGSTVKAALARSASVQAVQQLQQLERLELIARLFANDPYLAGYVAQAAESRDSLSILDLLDERQGDLGFDFAIVLDPEGRVLARTDRPDAVGADLSDRALVTTALDELEAFGFWEEGEALYQAAAVPLTGGRILVGFLIVGFEVDEVTALEIRRVSDTDVAFVAGPAAQPRVLATTLEPALAEGLAGLLAERPDVLGPVLGEGRTVEVGGLALAGRPWAAQVRPLPDPEGRAVGAAVSLAPLDRELAPFRRISSVLAGVGLAAVLLGSALSYLLSRRALAPVRRLTAAAEAAEAGDYEHEIATGGSDEVRRLGAAFNGLLAELREKQDMERYLSELSRTVPEEAAAPAPTRATARRERLAVVAVELRGVLSGLGERAPAEALGELAAAARTVERVATLRGGRLLAVTGHRVLAGFPGDDRCEVAAEAAAEALAILGSRTVGGPPPQVAVADGTVVTGAVGPGDSAAGTAVGVPLVQIDALLAETSPGEIAMTAACHRAVAERFADRGVELPAKRGVRTTQTLYMMGEREAERLVGPRADAPTLVATTETPAAGRELPPGTSIGDRFEVRSVLGAGGMGVVYQVWDRELDDVVALKMLKPGSGDGAELLDRLKEELKLARRITHPNVLRTFDFGEIDGTPFITMEYVRGTTLRSLLQQSGRLPTAAGLHLARQLCRGLEAAHEMGVVHRDIKPENLLVQPNGNAKLMDFGIARPTTARLDAGLTQPGTVVGTPRYLAPEQLRGEGADARSDLYACGVVFYELFTGHLPFEGRSGMEVIGATLHEEPEPPSVHWPEIPPALEAILLRCLAKAPEARFASAAELLDELEELRG